MSSSQRYSYSSQFVDDLFVDIGRLILQEQVSVESVWLRLLELGRTNSPDLAAYWRATEEARGIPDSVFKTTETYYFDDCEPSRTFKTSGTSMGRVGHVNYSPRGIELMRLSILENARKRILHGLEAPAIVRLVPPPEEVPDMVMAYGMDLIARTLGDPEFSAVVVGRDGVNYPLLEGALRRATESGVPVVLLGGSSAFVNICRTLREQNVFFELPEGSKVVDAGGFKTLSKKIHIAQLRNDIMSTFGIGEGGFLNIFGMTELASQLYDAIDIAIGPNGERPKAGTPFVELRVRSPYTMDTIQGSLGLLEIADLCIMDRPPVVLTGDLGIATSYGLAVLGRIPMAGSRGCSLSLDEMTLVSGAPGRSLVRAER
jgi:Acyl-protein synthetase, LuxE